MMIMRPALQSLVTRQDDAKYHGGKRSGGILGCVWHETDSMRWVGEWGTHWYLNSGQKVASYTYAIERDGGIFRFCSPDLIAYHAGKHVTAGPPAWNKGGSANGRTIGVAFINKVARGAPLTVEQLRSGLWLGTVLQETHGYSSSMNYGHGEICPTWKSDPMPEQLNMSHWRAQLALDVWPDVIITSHPEKL